jgi:hypothetical protein
VAVARSRLVSAALLAVLAFGLDASRGVPSRLTTVTRAFWCCSTVCHHAHGAAAATRCCGSDHDATELTATPPQKPVDVAPPGATPAVALAVVPAAPVAYAAGSARVSAPRARGAPVFLLNRSFRI